ncbi:glycosyltransferase [Bifidobacterium saguinibicoloris]|uniref:glycosyltransferase n=1 Tax=Bifidobacterium saguinibicoloris TaxID=2834433 RepID=UPI001C58D8A2|nr:glycosyltransferase [Bifidobacterium saguinibicoloris]MBW3081304.1 glycosyltransferase [Bifidobacterium saguinibicoloris]
MQLTVTAVVVSYNREALLQECLDGIAAQTRPVDRIVVVDNASTDGALQVIRNHPLLARATYLTADGDAASTSPDIAASTAPDATVIALPHNTGGAGGFCAGIAEAIAGFGGDAVAQSRHYVWVMDDDTVPTPGALEALLAAVARCAYENRTMPAVLGSKALWVDGREHLMNKPRQRTWVRKGDRLLDMSSFADESEPSESSVPSGPAAYQVRSLSFVSCLMNAGAILTLSRLPRAAYFLWNDDFEFTSALLRRGIGYYVPASEVVHKTKVFGSSDADPGARFYNEVRNKIWLFRFSRGNFSGSELVEFLLKTARRWVLTWLRSSDRATIADCFRRGRHDGFRTKPASNAEIFADVPEVVEAIRVVEPER